MSSEKPEGVLDKLTNAAVFFLVILPCTLVMQAMWNCRRDEVRNHVATEKMEVIYLREDFYYYGESHRQVTDQVLVACKGLWDESKPVLNVDGELWYAMDQSRYRGQGPAPAFIQRQTVGDKSNDAVIYAAFKTDPIAQARAWLKANGYSEADFKLEQNEIAPECETSSLEVSCIWPKKGESKINMKGILSTSMGYVWFWDAGSGSVTANSDTAFFKAYSKAIQKIAK